MKSEWESMTVDELFVLREKVQEVLIAKGKANKVELKRRMPVLIDCRAVSKLRRPASQTIRRRRA